MNSRVPYRFDLSSHFSGIMLTVLLVVMVVPLLVLLPPAVRVVAGVIWVSAVLLGRYARIDGRSPLWFLVDWLVFRSRARRFVYRNRHFPPAMWKSRNTGQFLKWSHRMLLLAVVILTLAGGYLLSLSVSDGCGVAVTAATFSTGVSSDVQASVAVPTAASAVSVTPAPVTVSAVSVSSVPMAASAVSVTPAPVTVPAVSVSSIPAAPCLEGGQTVFLDQYGLFYLSSACPIAVSIGDVIPAGEWWIWLTPTLVRAPVGVSSSCSFCVFRWPRPVYELVPVSEGWGALVCWSDIHVGIRASRAGRVEWGERTIGMVMPGKWELFWLERCGAVRVVLDAPGMMEAAAFVR